MAEAKVVGKSNGVILALLVACLAAIILTWAAWLKSRYNVAGFEPGLFRAINNWPDGLKLLFLPITEFGSLYAAVAVMALAWLTKKSELAVRLFIYSGVTYVLTVWLKALVDRPRPIELLPNIHDREPVVLNSLGFPSGHTATVTVLALLVWPALPKPWRWIVPIWIIGVGLSRIYLGVHMPLDIIGGFAVGVCVVSGGFVIEKLARKA